jgi:hypothetical protein
MKKFLYGGTKSIKTIFTTSGIFFLLFSLLVFSGSAKCQQALLTDDSKLKDIISKNLIYPEDAKKQGIEGDFYIIVKMDSGKIKKLTLINNDKKIEQPIIIMASIVEKTKSKSTEETKNFVLKPLAMLEDEAVRVIKLFELVNITEWNSKMTEFAVHFKFKLN